MLDLVRELRCTVVHLGDVLCDVVELPYVVVERRVGPQSVVVEGTDRVEGHCLPPVVVNGTRSEHLEVLGDMPVTFVFTALAKCIGEACAVEMRLVDPVDLLRRADADQLEDGREDIDGVGVLAAEGAGGGGPAACGQPDDAGVRDTAFVYLALPALERCVPRHRPSPWVVRVTERSSDLVDPSEHLADPGRVEVRKATLVDGAFLSAFRAGAVVRHQDHQGLVGLSQVLNEIEHATDLLVRVREVSGKALHEALRQRSLSLVE